MKNKVTGIMSLVLALLGGGFLTAEERWIHPRCEVLPLELAGPFVKLADGSLLAVEGNTTRISRDGGGPGRSRARSTRVQNRAPREMGYFSRPTTL